MIKTKKNTNYEEGKARTKKPSMTTLVSWNVSKALEHNPRLDLRVAIKSAQERLENSDVTMALEESSRLLPEERYLACALLAWQRLGHDDGDSLYSFVAINRNETNSNEQPAKDERASRPGSMGSVNSSRDLNLFQNRQEYSAQADVWRMGASTSINASSLGPVLKIPSVPKTVMRLEDAPIKIRSESKAGKSQEDDKNDRLSLCCLDSDCVETLEKMDKITAELRNRAMKLAHREADRSALLERAETAWRDLESGYQRRLTLASEKEDDILRQNEKIASDRNIQKTTCTALMKQLESETKTAESEKAQLDMLEKTVCDEAVQRAQMLERAAATDGELADVLCKIAQLDRDITFREQQMSRKQQALESEVEAAMALTLEADRAMRAELLGLLDQVQQVARDLMAEDKDSCRFQCDLTELREERDALSDDLEGCHNKCDAPMQKKMDEIKSKREELARVREEEMECRCKMPVDKCVSVKRTASLAALCECEPEDAQKSGCSCTSMRGRLLSDLLFDLFRGLQSQLCHDTVMPCQMLKCLEDKHKWDGASDVKTNLRNYFSNLLLGELDIAIATSIENYHVKWVGESCADRARAAKAIPCGVSHTETWQEHALEHKAKQMAEMMAEKMFEQKAQELADQAKDILANSGRPPCECHPANCITKTKTVYQCLVKPPRNRSPVPPAPQMNVRQALQGVTSLRTQIKNLKKDTINREDLNMMEKNIVKMVNYATMKPRAPICKALNSSDKFTKKAVTLRSSVDTSLIQKPIKKRKLISNNKKIPKINKTDSTKTKSRQPQISVNMCIIDPQKEPCVPSKLSKQIQGATKSKSYQSGLVKNLNLPDSSTKLEKTSKRSDFGCSKLLCTGVGSCFHKKPSNTSIDKLLETLSKWKEDLIESRDKRSVKSTQHNSSSNKCCSNISNNSNSSKSIQVQNQSNVVIKKGISKLVVSKLSSQKIEPSINDEKIETTKSSVQVKDYFSAVLPILPISIESEYMGAMDLEKSSISCKKEKHIKETRNTCNKYPAQIPYKCIGSRNCPCRDCFSVPVCHEQGLDAPSFILDLIPCCEQSKRNSNNLPSNKTVNNEISDSANSALSNVIESSGNSEIGYKNHIKCLGVTLTNGTSKKSLKTKTNPKKNTKKTVKKKDFYDIINNKKIPLAQSFVFNEKSVKNRRSLTNINHIKVNKSANSIGSHKLQKMCNSEICICCQNIDTENSKDLEVNTFQLLEEHVKGKLEEFKKTFCDSSCIPTAEEEKLFTTIVQRIKLLIAECTRPPASCRCANNTNQVNGSWNRAYVLLQEYLKTKMERARCQCGADSKLKGINDLPKVLNKISLLIENDVQRIKSICKCKKSVFYQSMQAKSCTAMTIDHKYTEVQTVDEIKLSIDEYSSVKSDLVNNDAPEVDRTIRETKLSKTSKQSKEMTQSAHNIDKPKKEFCEAPLPYIGYTLNCCCNHDLGCVCTKSKVRAVDDKLNINNIRKNLTNEVAVSKKHSYTLDNTPDKLSKDMNYIQIAGGCYKKTISKARSVQVTKINVCETIVNKSNKNRETVNEATNTQKRIKNHKTVYNVDDSLENCGLISKPVRRENNSLAIVKQNKLDDIYFPGDNFKLSDNSDMAFEKSDSRSTNCDCKLVPICHVKMLVANIEDKLANAQCTCDSLSPKVCPVHS